MKKICTKLEGVFILEPEIFYDERGWFYETFNRNTMREIGIVNEFVQDNHSFSKRKGTLRGLHFQEKPYSQAKLVRVIRGKVFDVAVDLREYSRTYLQWVGVELSSENKRQFLIPRGFAHGFVTLEDNTEFVYKVDNVYNRSSDKTIKYNDKKVGITWPILNPILSVKDENAPTIEEYEEALL